MVDEKPKAPSSPALFPEKEYASISEKADELYYFGKKKETIAELEKGLALSESRGDEAFRLFFLGELAHYKENNNKKALELELKAASIRNNSCLILQSVGILLSFLGSYEEALEWLDKALEINPGDYRSLRNKGVSLSNLGLYEKSLEWFDKAVEVNPGDYHSLRQKGVSLGHLGQHEEALEWYNRSLDQNPKDYRAMGSKGIKLGAMGRNEEGLEWLNRALKINPDYVHLLRNRANILHKLGRTEEARKDVKRALKIQPQDKQTLYLDQIFAQEERKRAEIEAREKKIRMDAWRRLSARAAHRIGNQLFAARGALKTLENKSDPAFKETTEDLLEALKQIQRLNSQFKKFSTKEEARLESVSAKHLVETVLRRYHKQAEEKEVQLRKIIKTEKTWPLDRSMMEEALGELMENALNHTPARGSITIEANQKQQQGKSQLFLAVENTGEGVPVKYKEKIFDAFFTTSSEGTGLGLAIVRKFIDLHGGRIRETGTSGKSARFEITLPSPAPEEAIKS